MWILNGNEFDPTEFDFDNLVGFVYCITDLSNNKKYIGKKGFWSRRKLKPLKGKTRNRIVKKESDWMKYYGSNEQIKLLLEEHGPTRWNRTILRLCKSKGEMSYYEAKLQFDKNVLFDPNYYNEFIGLKIHSKHVANLIEEMMNGRD